MRSRRRNVIYIFLQDIREQRSVLERFLAVNEPDHPRPLLDAGLNYRPDQKLLVSIAVSHGEANVDNVISVSCMMVLEIARKGDGDDRTDSHTSLGEHNTVGTGSSGMWTSVGAS